MTLRAMAEPAEGGPERKILIAIDFGTTYTGVAWAQTARPDTKSIIVQWPDADGCLEGQTSDKVPTTILYDENTGKKSWGFQINEDEKCYQWFKLSLNPKYEGEMSHLSIEYPDPRALSQDSTYDGPKLVTDYLSCLRKHVLEVLKLKLGEFVVDTTPIEYIMTVPAIWDDAAKNRTAECARAAGLGENVKMISEPEAAVVAALDQMDPHNLKVGDTFVLCDAGGGTLDLISYSIAQLVPTVKIKEAVAGNGDHCGSTFLNRVYRKLMEEQYSELEGWDEDTLEEAMRNFEEVVKRKFTGEEISVVVKVPGLVDDAEHKIKRGKLTLPTVTLKSVFDRVIAIITTLVKGQLNQTQNPSAILLVGGFGGSPYLRKYLQKVVGTRVEVLTPTHGWTSVVQGALIRALSEELPDISRLAVTSRVARRSYGLQIGTYYEEGDHPDNLKYWDSFDGFYRVSVMEWQIHQGEQVDQAQPIDTPLVCRQLVSAGPFQQYTVQVYSFTSKRDEKAPVYPGSVVKRLVKLTADLSAISKTLVPIKKGWDGNDYYDLHYQIKTAFFSAHTEYSLWYKGVEYGKVRAEYA